MYIYSYNCKFLDAWKAVTDKVQDARTNARMKHLPHAGINGAAMLGLTHSAVTFLTEQLFGAQKCHKYNFKYHHYEQDSDDEVFYSTFFGIK